MKNTRGIGPYSGAFRRGIGAGYIDGRTVLGRYIKSLQTRLVRHAGGPDATIDSIPITTRLLIERIVRATVQIELLDRKLESGGDKWLDHDSRTHNGLINRQRLLLREIGMKAAQAPQMTIAERIRAAVAAQKADNHDHQD